MVLLLDDICMFGIQMHSDTFHLIFFPQKPFYTKNNLLNNLYCNNCQPWIVYVLKTRALTGLWYCVSGCEIISSIVLFIHCLAYNDPPNGFIFKIRQGYMDQFVSLSIALTLSFELFNYDIVLILCTMCSNRYLEWTGINKYTNKLLLCTKDSILYYKRSL